MNIRAIKSEVFQLLEVSSTPELKKKWPASSQSRDFRFKKTWASVLNEILAENPKNLSDSQNINIKSAALSDIQRWLDHNTAQIDAQREKHRQMFYATGSILGWSVKECDRRWDIIQGKAKAIALQTT